EAPGLERFFDVENVFVSPADVQEHPGIIDLLVSYRELRALPSLGAAGTTEPRPSGDEPAFPYPVEPLDSFVVRLNKPAPGQGALMLIPAGRRAGARYADYADRVRAFNWDEFYLRWSGAAFFDWFRSEAEELAPVVLVDSRTGITELAGVSTFQLA